MFFNVCLFFLPLCRVVMTCISPVPCLPPPFASCLCLSLIYMYPVISPGQCQNVVCTCSCLCWTSNFPAFRATRFPDLFWIFDYDSVSSLRFVLRLLITCWLNFALVTDLAWVYSFRLLAIWFTVYQTRPVSLDFAFVCSLGLSLITVYLCISPCYKLTTSKVSS